MVEGEPGIGKTTIWDEAVSMARARGIEVLSCRPRRSDATLSDLALTDLLRSVPADAFRALPAPQRVAIEVATLRREARDAELDSRAVATALTTLLANLSSSASLLVAVDDAQWLDPPSANALVFALHRLDDRDVRLLMAIRVEPVSERTFPVVAAVEDALGRDRVQRTERWSAERRRAALGDPAGPRQIGDAPDARPHSQGVRRQPVLRARDRQRNRANSGTVAPGQPLPVPVDRRDLALLRLRRLPRATRDALAQVAARSRPSTKDIDLAALGPAESAGIVRCTPAIGSTSRTRCSAPRCTRRYPKPHVGRSTGSLQLVRPIPRNRRGILRSLRQAPRRQCRCTRPRRRRRWCARRVRGCRRAQSIGTGA